MREVKEIKNKSKMSDIELFFAAVEGGHVNTVKYYLETVGIHPDAKINIQLDYTSYYCPITEEDITIRYVNEPTALHVAIRNNHLDVARVLVEHGADVMAVCVSWKESVSSDEVSIDNHKRITPLHSAVLAGSYEIVQFLLTLNDVDPKAFATGFSKKFTPLDFATREKYDDRDDKRPYDIADDKKRCVIAELLCQNAFEKKKRKHDIQNNNAISRISHFNANKSAAFTSALFFFGSALLAKTECTLKDVMAFLSIAIAIALIVEKFSNNSNFINPINAQDSIFGNGPKKERSATTHSDKYSEPIKLKEKAEPCPEPDSTRLSPQPPPKDKEEYDYEDEEKRKTSLGNYNQ